MSILARILPFWDFVDKLLNNSNSAKAEFISIYLPVVKNVTYMTAVVFRNNNP